MIQGRSNAWAAGTTIIEANKRLGYPSRESVSAHCIQTGPIGHRSRAQARHCVRAPCAPQLFGVGADPVDHPKRGPVDL